MKCPVCTAPDLVMSERQGIEIDYCPKCRGIWLDRGELDKLIEKASRDGSESSPSAPTSGQPHAQPYQQPHPSGHPHSHPQGSNYRPEMDDSKYGYQYKRKKAWWTEIFD
ncbi:MAG: zf-TFIIB domain-containing protein [Planctomycetota bacterium]|nr:zf-TFIIB domain-containing protein [Planctomycetota bacterium]